MGFVKDIEDMPNQLGYSRTFFDRWYRPEYTTVVVAGDVDPAAVLPLVEKYWGGWKRGSHTVDVPREPAPKGPVYAHVPWKTKTLPWVTVAFHGPAFSETAKDFAAVDLLFELWFGETSDLYRRLVQREQKVDQLRCDVSPSQDPGLVGAWARVKSPEDALYVRDALLETFARARTCSSDSPLGSASLRAVSLIFGRSLRFSGDEMTARTISSPRVDFPSVSTETRSDAASSARKYETICFQSASVRSAPIGIPRNSDGVGTFAAGRALVERRTATPTTARARARERTIGTSAGEATRGT